MANYNSGSVTVLSVGADGRLGPSTALVEHQGENPSPRDPGPHAHSVHLDAANQFALVADLGLDKIFVYRFDPAKGTLTPHAPPSAPLALGAGPRHFTFDKAGKGFYVIRAERHLDAFTTRGQGHAQRDPPCPLPADFKSRNRRPRSAGPAKFFTAQSRTRQPGHLESTLAREKLTPRGHQKVGRRRGTSRSPRNVHLAAKSGVGHVWCSGRAQDRGPPPWARHQGAEAV